MKIIIKILLWFWTLLGIFTFCAGVFIFISGMYHKEEGYWLDGSFFIAISFVSVIMYFMNKRRMTLYVTNGENKDKKK